MIIIIGGGVFGLSIGWALAKAGCEVTLLERDTVGQSATWAAAGMLMPWRLSANFSQGLFNLQRESHALWPSFAQELQATSSIDLDYQSAGRYFVAVHEQAAARLRKQYTLNFQLDVPVEWLSGAEAQQRVPAFGPQVQAAIFSPLGHWVDNRRLIPALRQVFVAAGGQLYEQTPVEGLALEGGQVAGVRVGGQMMPATQVIVAAGAWSGQIPGLPHPLQGCVKPRKGQTLILQMPAQAPLISQPVLGPVYLVPRPDGRLVVGTTVEREAGFDTRPTAGGIHEILTKALRIVPALKDLSIIEMGAGLRPTAPDRLPVLGPTQIAGLTMATGGHAHGILLSPIVAEAIREFVITGQVPKIILPFLPS